MGNSDDSEKSSPYREAVTTRVTPQNYERYEAYAERESLSKSEALRQLIRAGLDEKEREEETALDTLEGFGVLLVYFGGVMAVLFGIDSGNHQTLAIGVVGIVAALALDYFL